MLSGERGKHDASIPIRVRFVLRGALDYTASRMGNLMRLPDRLKLFLSTCKPEVIPVCLLLLVSLVCFSALLFRGQMIAGDERVDGYYQYGVFLNAALSSGDAFLWNPHSYGGFPTHLNQFVGFLFPPIVALYAALDPFVAYHLIVASVFFLGLASSYALSRMLGMSRMASIIVAMSYAVVQIPHTFHLGLSYVHSFFFLPFLLLGIVGAKRAQTTHAFILWIIAASSASIVGFLAGYFVTFVYALVFAGFFALFLDVKGSSLGYGRDIRACTVLTVAFFLGLLAGLPQLIGLYEYMPFTARSATFAKEAGVGTGVGVLDFLRLLIPYQFEYPIDPGRGYFYYGPVALLSILVAIVSVRTLMVKFLIALYALFLLLAMNAPLFQLINLHVPPFSRMGSVSRWLLVGSFAGALLAGYGFDWLFTHRESIGIKRVVKFYALVLGSVVALLAIVQVPLKFLRDSTDAQAHLFEMIVRISGKSVETLSHPKEVYIQVLTGMITRLHETFSFSNPAFVIFLLVSTGVVFCIVQWRQGHAGGRARLMLLAFALMTTMSSFVYGLGNTVAISWFKRDVPEAVRAIRAQETDPSSYRFISFQGDLGSRAPQAQGMSPETRVTLMKEFLYRETGTFYGLRSLSGFEPIRPRRHNLLIDGLLAPHADTVPLKEALVAGVPLDTYSHERLRSRSPDKEKAEFIQKIVPLLSSLNVKYLVSIYKLSSPNLEEISRVNVDPLVESIYIYRNREAKPRLYLASDVRSFVGTEHELLRALLFPTEASSYPVLVECGGCTLSGGEGAIGRVVHANGFAAASVTMRTPGLIVLSESNLPGWIAEIDGVRTPIFTAQYLAQALVVPEGVHSVVWCYPGSFALFLERVGLREVSCAAQ